MPPPPKDAVCRATANTRAAQRHVAGEDAEGEARLQELLHVALARPRRAVRVNYQKGFAQVGAPLELADAGVASGEEADEVAAGKARLL